MMGPVGFTEYLKISFGEYLDKLGLGTHGWGCYVYSARVLLIAVITFLNRKGCSEINKGEKQWIDVMSGLGRTIPLSLVKDYLNEGKWI